MRRSRCENIKIPETILERGFFLTYTTRKMKHFMKLQSRPFQKIVSGEKTIEVRLYDEKRQQVYVGDEIEFTEIGDAEKKITKTVTHLSLYKTFRELFESRDPKMFGGESVEGLLTQIKQFYSTEDEEKYGVVGIEIR